MGTESGSFLSWWKELWRETASRVLFLAGATSTFIQFFVSGLSAHALRILGILLVVVGFVWANFQLYRRLAVESTIPPDVFQPTCSIEGAAPATQYLVIHANTPFQLTRVEYLLADGTMIVGKNINSAADTHAKIQIEDDALLAVQNMPQPQRQPWDASCPVRFRISFRAGNSVNVVVHPAWIRTKMVGSTCYRQVVG